MKGLERVLTSIEGRKIIAIDGRSAAGKTTLAEELLAVTGGDILHMDDFFLPPELRTAQRYSEPGGNIHRERFQEEILPFLRNESIVKYRRFDCQKGAYDANLLSLDTSRTVIIEGAYRTVIIEGAYSLLPVFGKYYDISIFVDIDPERQLERIRKRNGKEKAEVFRTKWIPLEEAYIKAYSIDKSADLIIDGCQE